jgi:hypothetical protein
VTSFVSFVCMVLSFRFVDGDHRPSMSVGRASQAQRG